MYYVNVLFFNKIKEFSKKRRNKQKELEEKEREEEETREKGNGRKNHLLMKLTKFIMTLIMM
jgi:hypothetical protein